MWLEAGNKEELSEIDIMATETLRLILYAGKPHKEPVVARHDHCALCRYCVCAGNTMDPLPDETKRIRSLVVAWLEAVNPDENDVNRGTVARHLLFLNRNRCKIVTTPIFHLDQCQLTPN